MEPVAFVLSTATINQRAVNSSIVPSANASSFTPAPRGAPAQARRRRQRPSGWRRCQAVQTGDARSSSQTSPPVDAAEQTLHYDREAWIRTYSDLTREDSYRIPADVVGPLPKDLVGTLFRNGPAKYTVGPDHLRHPWEGDGAITAFTFPGDGTCWFRNRFVQTRGYLREKAAGRQLYRGTFATPKPGGWLANLFEVQQKNLANTNVIYFAKRLLALYEGGLPHALTPDDLRTEGEVRLGGVLAERGETFTAHPHVDPVRGNRLVGFSSRMRFGGMSLRFLEFEADTWKLLSERSVDIPGFGFFHDFMFTQRYYLLLQAPIAFDVWPFVLGLRTAGESIRWLGDRRNAKLWLIPRDRPEEPAHVIECEPCSVFHWVNARDDGDAVVLDGCRMDRLFYGDSNKSPPGDGLLLRGVDFARGVPKSTLWRCRIELPRDGCAGRATWKRLSDIYLELPMLNGRRLSQPYRYAYFSAGAVMTAPSPFRRVVKLDARSGELLADWVTAAPHEFVGEPVFVPRPTPEGDTAAAEDFGYLLVLVHDGRHLSNYLAVLDAQTLRLVSRVPLRHYVPTDLHGSWTPVAFAHKPFTPTAAEIFARKRWNAVNSSFNGLGLSVDL